MQMQSALRLIYPDQCVSCGDLTDAAGRLCGPCWRETPFVSGPVCDACGTPLIDDGRDAEAATGLRCDDCLTLARPWARGRAALVYEGNARRLVLALKHGDRLDLAGPAARWMARAAAPLLRPGQLLVPVPVHRLRLVLRRYNQAAVLAAALSRETGRAHRPDVLVRRRRTSLQDGMSRVARFANVAGAIAPHPRRGGVLAGRDVLLVDDVMTSGATLAAAAEAVHVAGAARVDALVLARVAKDA